MLTASAGDADGVADEQSPAVWHTPNTARSVWMEAVLHGLASCLWHSLDSRWAPPGEVRVRSLDPQLWQELSVVHRGESGPPDPRLDVVRQFAELVVGS